LRQLARLLQREVSAHIPPEALTVDLGCGEMPYADMLNEMQIDYRGADIDDGASLKIDAQGRVPLPDGSAAAVLSIQVLEHVRDLDAYCSEMHRLLSDDGVLLLSTHGTWLYHPHPEDHRRWTRTGLIADLSDRRFVVEDVHAIAGPLATTTLIRLTGFAFALRKVPLIGGAFASVLAGIMNLRAMLEDSMTPAAIRNNDACVFLVRARKVRK
jgi:SAM-dependent methyltransferase